jgi:hypothetical protein
MNGLVFFINLALVASFLRGDVDWFAAKFSLGKFHGMLNYRYSLARLEFVADFPAAGMKLKQNRRSRRVLPLRPKLLTGPASFCKKQNTFCLIFAVCSWRF